MNMIKVMWCWFQQRLGTFTMLFVEGSSETGLFMHLSNHVFRVRSFGNTKAMRVIFFVSKHSKFDLDFKNAAKNWEENFPMWYNCIWSCNVKLSLWRTGQFSTVANMLTSSPKIFHVNKRDFFEHNILARDQWIWQRWCGADFNSVWARLPYCLSKHHLKRDFINIYLTTISESVTSKIQKLWWSSLVSKRPKFQIDFKKAPKKKKKNCWFGLNCIWIAIVKLSVLRTGYFSSAAMC